MVVLEKMTQNSEEWLNARKGRATVTLSKTQKGGFQLDTLEIVTSNEGSLC